MAARPAWKGTLKLSLITVPIRVYPATNPRSDVSFHQVHRKCHTRIQLKKWCPHCKREVSAGEIVKGYEKQKGRYVLVEAEDIAAVRPESTRVAEISHVLDAAVIDPIHVERSYYLAPDGKRAGEAYAVIREGLADKAAVGRLALHGREYLVAIVPRERALLLHTLRTKGEVRALKGIDELDFARGKVKQEEVKLIRQVLSSFETDASIEDFTDNYQAALRKMLETKGAEAPVQTAEGEAPAKVVDLMDALRQSLGQVKATKKKGRVLAHPAAKQRRRAKRPAA
jgi:DNA end-binding protein Ku